MTLAEIRQECWDIAGELSSCADEDRLWSTAEMNRYINRVERFVAKETLCISDSNTPSICLLESNVVDYTTYTPGTLDYIWANDPDSWLYQKNVCPYLFPLDSKIVSVDEVKWTKRQWKLTKVASAKWQENPYWEQVVGMPTEYATDLQSHTIALNFRDTYNDVLRLVVKRLPLTDMVDDSDSPEIKESYHDFLVNGVLYHMYRKQDAEAFDEEKSNNYYALFMKDIDEIKQQESIMNRHLRPNYAMSAFR